MISFSIINKTCMPPWCNYGDASISQLIKEMLQTHDTECSQIAILFTVGPGSWHIMPMMHLHFFCKHHW